MLVGAHFVGVFDGTTAKHPVRLAGQTPGAFAAQHVAAAFSRLDADASMADAVGQVADSLKRAGESHGFTGREVEPPSCTMLVVSFARNELWSVGDGFACIGGEHLALRAPPSDGVIARFRDLYQSLLLARGADPDELFETDPAHDLVMPVLSLQWHLRNHPDSPWGYGAIDGGPVPDRYQLCRSLGDAGQVVLTTDGYLSAAPTLADAEAELATLAAQDPLLLSGHGTRARPSRSDVAFDDRSYVRVVR